MAQNSYYGLDPEVMSLTGPRAMQGAFDASLQGFQLGDRLATSALNRELSRRHEGRVLEDRQIAADERLIGATMGSGSSGTTGSVGTRRSTGSGASAPAVMSMGDYLRQQVENPPQKTLLGTGGESDIGRPSQRILQEGRPSQRILQQAGVPPAETSILARIRTGELTGEQGDALLADVRSMEGVVPGAAPARIPLANPMAELGYQQDYLPSVKEAGRAIITRRKQLGLSDEQASDKVRQYEDYHNQVTGAYRDKMRSMQGAADLKAQNAQVAHNARIMEGIDVENALRDGRLSTKNLTLGQTQAQAYAAFHAADETANPSKQRQLFSSTKESSKAEQLKAAIANRKQRQAEVNLGKQKRAAFLIAREEGLVEWDKAKNVSPNTPLSPSEEEERDAHGNRRGSTASDIVGDSVIARQVLVPATPSGSGGKAPDAPMSVDEAMNHIRIKADQLELNWSEDDLLFAAQEAIKDERVVLSLRKGTVNQKSASSDSWMKDLAIVFAGGEPPSRADKRPSAAPKVKATVDANGDLVIE